MLQCKTQKYNYETVLQFDSFNTRCESPQTTRYARNKKKTNKINLSTLCEYHRTMKTMGYFLKNDIQTQKRPKLLIPKYAQYFKTHEKAIFRFFFRLIKFSY